jgi:hypothetical protein
MLKSDRGKEDAIKKDDFTDGIDIDEVYDVIVAAA